VGGEEIMVIMGWYGMPSDNWCELMDFHRIMVLSFWGGFLLPISFDWSKVNAL